MGRFLFYLQTSLLKLFRGIRPTLVVELGGQDPGPCGHFSSASSCRPTELQRNTGERLDALPPEPELLESPDGGESGPGPLAVPRCRGGRGRWLAEAGPPARIPALHASLCSPAEFQLLGFPVHLPRSAMDHSGQGPALPSPGLQRAPPSPCGQQRGRSAQGGGHHPGPGDWQLALGGRSLEDAGSVALPVGGAAGLPSWGCACPST